MTEYDPSRSPTPKHLGRQIKELGQYLRMQSRRVGGQLAREAYAKQHGHNVVLYLVMHPNFIVQDKVIREVCTEGLWRMWARRCHEAGKVARQSRAHVVLLDNDLNVIGGSKVDDADDIWVTK